MKGVCLCIYVVITRSRKIGKAEIRLRKPASAQVAIIEHGPDQFRIVKRSFHKRTSRKIELGEVHIGKDIIIHTATNKRGGKESANSAPHHADHLAIRKFCIKKRGMHYFYKREVTLDELAPVKTGLYQPTRLK